MAWKLKNTTKAIQRWPHLQGVKVLTLPSGADSSDFWEFVEETFPMVPSDKVEEIFPMGTKGTSAITRCPCDCKKLPEFTGDEVDRALQYLSSISPISSKIPFNEIVVGMNEEREHCDITGGDPVLSARIALAHLKETPDYYIKLKKAGL